MKRRCLFLDRDGVINVKPAPGEYVRNWEQFRFLPGIAEWIRLFNVLDFLVIVVTNQRGVARGLIKLEDLAEIHSSMTEQLARRGARVDDIFFCPHEEDTCDCRKPRPGLLRRAQEKWNIDLIGSLLIGDSPSDRELAAVCGIPFVLASQGQIRKIVPGSPVK